MTPPDDWAVVEEALNESCSDWQLHNKYLDERPDWYENGHAALARLREREAQREAQIGGIEADVGFLTDYLGAQGDLIERVKGWNDRAEAAEARVAELEAALEQLKAAPYPGVAALEAKEEA